MARFAGVELFIVPPPFEALSAEHVLELGRSAHRTVSRWFAVAAEYQGAFGAEQHV